MSAPPTKIIGACVSAELAESVRDQARLENRTVSNLVRTALIDRIARTALIAANGFQGPAPEADESAYIGAGRRRRRKPTQRITTGPMSVDSLLIRGATDRRRRERAAQAAAAATASSSED